MKSLLTLLVMLLIVATIATLLIPTPAFATHSGPWCQTICQEGGSRSCQGCQTHCGDFGCCTYDCGGSLVGCQNCDPPV